MGPRSEFAEFSPQLAQALAAIAAQGRTHVFVACMPKTASTFISRTIRRLTALGICPLYLAKTNEQDMSLMAMDRLHNQDTITFQHVRATPSNLFLMRHAGLVPVVTSRNFADVAVSVRDMIEKERARPFFNAFIPYTDQFLQLDHSRQLDMIVDVLMPWFFSFYVTWHDACRFGNCPASWLTYEQFLADKPGAIMAILAKHGIHRTREQVQGACDACNSDRNRVNKGVAGRGRQELSDDQLARLRAMADYYPWVDFSLVGIDRPVVCDQPGRPIRMLLSPVSQGV